MANLTEEVRHSSGGKLVTVETAPYTVAIRCGNTGALCTGTLITLDLVLTLARCFYKGHELKESASSVVVLAGVDTLANTTLSVGGRIQRRRGRAIAIHPNFRPTPTNASFGYNDLAVVLVTAEFRETATVQPIKVSFLDWNTIESIKCKVASYAAVNPLTQSHYDEHLKQSEVVIARPCKCRNTVVSAFGSRTHRWLCGVPHQSGSTPCVGAGGAGLVCGGKLIGMLMGLLPFSDLRNCKFAQKKTMVSCDNRNTIPIFLDLCPFMPWFRFISDEDLPTGPINCSKASSHYDSLTLKLLMFLTSLRVLRPLLSTSELSTRFRTRRNICEPQSDCSDRSDYVYNEFLLLSETFQFTSVQAL